MNFDAWLAAPRPKQLGDAERKIVIDMCDALRDPVAPANLDPDEAFYALRRYAPGKFSYMSISRGGIADCLQQGALNCGAAADLVVGVLLYLSGKDLDVQRFLGAINGQTQRPLVTPPVEQAGVKITNNLEYGGARVFFSGGHTIAVVSDIQYDLIGGFRGHHIDYTQAYRNDEPDGTPAFDCNLDGLDYRLIKLDGNTPEGLSTFRAVLQVG